MTGGREAAGQVGVWPEKEGERGGGRRAAHCGAQAHTGACAC